MTYIRKISLYVLVFIFVFLSVSMFATEAHEDTTETSIVIEPIDIKSINNINTYNSTAIIKPEETKTEYENNINEMVSNNNDVITVEETEETENKKSETKTESETTKETIEVLEETKENEPEYITKYVPSNNSFKSFMSYKAITSKSSQQYRLQKSAYTGEHGIRMINDRYCIALGSYYTTAIGTKIDVVMANGNILKCILGDQKDNKHTDSKNIKAHDGSVIEFIIDKRYLSRSARKMGDISYADNKFAGEIVEIRIYIE